MLTGIASGMKYLQTDFAAALVYGLGNNPVFVYLIGLLEDRSYSIGQAMHTRHEAAGDDERDTTASTFGIERRHAAMTIGDVFETGMHGAHEYAIFQAGKAKIQWFKQVRVSSRSRSWHQDSSLQFQLLRKIL